MSYPVINRSSAGIGFTIGEYQITRYNISKGAFAAIHLGKHIYTDRIVAIKALKVANIDNLKPYVRREIEIHRKLDHPNIVKLFDVIIHRETSTIYMIMEYCENGDLHNYQNKRPFHEKYIQHYMIQLRNALKYLYDNDIIHRDLKPQNILLTNDFTIKITDFGLSRTIQDKPSLETPSDIPEDLFSTYCGSPMYMSPEMLNHENYNSKSDLWSVGVILYQLITGHPPFQASNLKQLISKINTETINLYNLDNPDNTNTPDDPDSYTKSGAISRECFDLLQKLLIQNKKDRMDWNSFFTHEWFNDNMNLMVISENKIIENPLDYELFKKLNTPSMFIERPSLKSPPLKSPSIKLNGNKLNGNNIGKQDMLDKFDTLEQMNISKSKSGIPIYNKDINLSDLEQDDITSHISHSPINAISKPISIPHNRNRINTVKYTPSYDSSSSSISSTPTITPHRITYSQHTHSQHSQHNHHTHSQHAQHSQPHKIESPSRIANAIRFLKETYDYFNSDTKSL